METDSLETEALIFFTCNFSRIRRFCYFQRKGGKLFGVTVPPNNTLFSGTSDFDKPHLSHSKVLDFMIQTIGGHLKEDIIYHHGY